MIKTALYLSCIVLLSAAVQHGRAGITPPPNRAAVAKWDAEKGHLRVLYGDDAILEATLKAVDEDDREIKGVRVEFESQAGASEAKVTQRLRFTCRTPRENVGLVLDGTVFGSEEAFPAEAASGEAQKRFPLVRTCSGLSRNLRNNAVYDRRWDWVLIGPADGATRIVPEKKGERTEFQMKCEGRELELVFKPRFYQKHKNLPFFEPWNYKIRKESITGYCTWWSYKGGFNQETLDKVLDLFSRKDLVDYGYDVFQIDACFASGKGGPESLLEWNKKFPGGPEYAVRKIKETGMTPGIHTWVVFRPGDPVVDGLVKEHPDTFLRKPDGSLKANNTYTLNPFNETALDRLIRPTYKGLRKQGWEYIKIDGQGNLMAWGFPEFPEHLEELGRTQAEALRALNIAAREELGDELFVLGCWSVRPELVGIIDGCRLGRDGYGPAEFQYFNSWNGVVWRNDPDHCDIWPEWVKSRKLPWYMECVDPKPDTPRPDTAAGPDVSDTIVRPCIISMASGMLMLSDKAEVYEDDRNIEGIRRASPVIFSVPGQLYDYNPLESDRIRDNTTQENLQRLPEPRLHMRHPQIPHAPQYGKQPTWWMLEIDKPFENWSVLARFNWRKLTSHWDRDRLPEQRVRFADLGLSDEKEYLVFEFWSRRFLGRSKGSFTAPEQPSDNGLQVFAIRQAREYPWVLSTSRHISQGGVDLINLRWEGSNRTLSGESAVVREDPYRIAVYLPEGFEFKSMESAGLRPEVSEEDNSVMATLLPRESGTMNWSMTFSR